MPVAAERQAPAVWLCVCTTLLFKPDPGTNGPLKPAAVQAARALATVEPTRSGTIWQVGSDDGAGGGVGAGVGNGAGVGLDTAVGLGADAGGAIGVGGAAGEGAPVGIAIGLAVGADVGEGPPTPGRDVGMAPGSSGAGPPGDVPLGGDVALPSPPGGLPFGEGDGGAVSNPPAPAVTAGCDDGPVPAAMSGRSDDSDDSVGDPRALSTPPVGPREDPTTSATARTAAAAALAAISFRRSRRCWFATRPSGRAIGPGVTLMPHPGHAPVAAPQQRSHAKTPQDRHIRSPTRRSVEAAPIRFPQRSQYGSGVPPDGGNDLGTLMIVRAPGGGAGGSPVGRPVIGLVGPVAPGGRGPCATGRATEGSWSRLDNTVVGQAPGAGGAAGPGGAPPMGGIGRKHTRTTRRRDGRPCVEVSTMPHRPGNPGPARLRRSLIVASITLLAIALLSPGIAAAAGPRPGGPLHDGILLSLCLPSHAASDDPIVHPGGAGHSHQHEFFGNTTTNADSTYASLRTGETTCRIAADSAAYWVPTLYADGERVAPLKIHAYYLRGRPGRVAAFPAGLKVIAGDSTATTAQSRAITGWKCSGLRPGGLSATPVSCATGSHAVLFIRFPDCWNGEDLDSANHQSHMAYRVRGACPAGYPVRVPRLALNVHYELPTGTDLSLASGSIYSSHADFFNAWNQATLARLVRTSLN